MGSRASSRHARVYHDLAVMLEAGLPILRALNSVRKGTGGRMKRALDRVYNQISAGSGIAEAMGESPHLFPEFDRQIIESSENSGRLDECLKMLAEWYEFQGRITRRALSGMILPMLMMIAAAFVFPLPRLLLGDIVGGEYAFTVVRWMAVFFVPAGIIVVIWKGAPRKGILRLIFDHMLLHIPVLAKGLRELSISRFFRSFGMLYRSGVPIIQALDHSVYATGNLAVSSMFKRCPQYARQGEMASQGLSRRIPQEYHDLWEVGEESGDLDRMVSKMADMSADKAELYLLQFSAWLPRLMYAIVVVAMVYMIFQLAQQRVATIMEFMG